MVKQHKRVTIILTCVMMLMMAACSSKSYSTVEEWYADNPAAQESMKSMMEDESTKELTIEFDVKENQLIYRYIYGEKIFGRSEEIDAAAKKMLDSGIEQTRSTHIQAIDQIARSSKIDASKISIVMEWYNPGANTPGYSLTITK